MPKKFLSFIIASTIIAANIAPANAAEDLTSSADIYMDEAYQEDAIIQDEFAEDEYIEQAGDYFMIPEAEMLDDTEAQPVIIEDQDPINQETTQNTDEQTVKYIDITSPKYDIRILKADGEAFPQNTKATIYRSDIEDPYSYVNKAMLMETTEPFEYADQIDMPVEDLELPVSPVDTEPQIYYEDLPVILTSDEDLLTSGEISEEPAIEDQVTDDITEPSNMDLPDPVVKKEVTVFPFHIVFTDEGGSEFDPGIVNYYITIKDPELARYLNDTDKVLIEDPGMDSERIKRSEFIQDDLLSSDELIAPDTILSFKTGSKDFIFAYKTNRPGVEFARIWKDYGFESQRPESIVYSLYNTNNMESPVSSMAITKEDAIDDYTWTGKFVDVPMYYTDGTKIDYVVVAERTMDDPNMIGWDLTFNNTEKNVSVLDENPGYIMAALVSRMNDGQIGYGSIFANLDGEDAKTIIMPFGNEETISSDTDPSQSSSISLIDPKKSAWDVFGIAPAYR